MATGSVDFARELPRPIGPQHEDDEPVFGDADGPDPDGVAHECEFGENAVCKKVSFLTPIFSTSVLMKSRYSFDKNHLASIYRKYRSLFIHAKSGGPHPP